MKRDLPLLHFVIGILLPAGTVEFKRHFTLLGQSSILIWTIDAISSALFGLGLAFSLRNLFLELSPRLTFSYLCCNLLAFSALFAFQISDYVLFSFVDSISNSKSVEMLPALTRNAQKLDSEAHRKHMAQLAYQICDTRITYRRDDASEVLYAPDISDENNWKLSRETDRVQARIRNIADEQLEQLPLVMTINAGAFLLTFIIPIWGFVFKRGNASMASLS